MNTNTKETWPHRHPKHTVVVTASVTANGQTFNKVETWVVRAKDEKTAMHSYWRGKLTSFKVA